jgi:hypothetical protein
MLLGRITNLVKNVYLCMYVFIVYLETLAVSQVAVYSVHWLDVYEEMN